MIPEQVLDFRILHWHSSTLIAVLLGSHVKDDTKRTMRVFRFKNHEGVSLGKIKSKSRISTVIAFCAFESKLSLTIVEVFFGQKKELQCIEH